MKKSYLFNLTLLWVFVLSVQASLAQDYTRWGLPEGAKARLGKGGIGDVVYSPDGRTLASGSDDGTILLWDMSPYVTLQSPDPDFDGDGAVGFADFLLFVAQFGSSQGDAGYDARYDLNGDGSIGFGDFLIFANAFGKAGSSN